MARTRTQVDGCGVAHASELLGQRWALIVVRELLLGPKRFTDLRAGIPDISPNVLAQRLRELEESMLVRRRKLAPPAAAQVYELTDWGRELEPALPRPPPPPLRRCTSPPTGVAGWSRPSSRWAAGGATRHHFRGAPRWVR